MGVVVVRFFGHFKEVAGRQEVTLHVPDPSSLNHIREILEETIPSMKAIQKQVVGVAVNQEMIQGDIVIHDGDEIAFLPPFSGGDGTVVSEQGARWGPGHCESAENKNRKKVSRQKT